MMSNPKAEEARRLFRNISGHLQDQLDKGLFFALDCLEHFCQGLRGKSKDLPFKKFEQVSEQIERIKSLCNISAKRLQRILKKVSEDPSNQNKVDKDFQKSLDRFKDLFYFFPKFRKTFKKYLNESSTLRENDIVNLLSKWKVHDELFLDNHTLKWCLDFLLEEKKEWTGKLASLDQQMESVLRLLQPEYTSLLRVRFHKTQKQKYSKLVGEAQVLVSHFHSEDYEKQRIAEPKAELYEFFQRIFQKSPFFVKNKTLWQPIEWVPSIFQTSFRKKLGQSRKVAKRSSINKVVPLESIYKSLTLSNQKRHLIVLLNGHTGSHRDMKLYRRFIGIVLPDAICLATKSVRNPKSEGILDMAKNLANEVIFMIKSRPSIGQISFVAHSSGGLVARACLRFLEPYKEQMNTFLSLGCPHLGGSFESSFFNTSKLFFWSNLTLDKFEEELQMKDADNPRLSLMYKLAQKDCLHWFENIILVNSEDQEKVSPQSARIEERDSQDPTEQTRVLNEMAQQIWAEVRNEAIVRVEVDLKDPSRCCPFRPNLKRVRLVHQKQPRNEVPEQFHLRADAGLQVHGMSLLKATLHSLN